MHNNEKGFILIEILASLVLLSIIITSFLHFFAQSMNLSAKNETKITSTSIARMTLTAIQETGKSPFEVRFGPFPPADEVRLTNDETIKELLKVDYTNEYDIDLIFKPGPDRLGLTQVDIEVKNNQDAGATSKLYTYLR